MYVLKFRTHENMLKILGNVSIYFHTHINTQTYNLPHAISSKSLKCLSDQI